MTLRHNNSRHTRARARTNDKYKNSITQKDRRTANLFFFNPHPLDARTSWLMHFRPTFPKHITANPTNERPEAVSRNSHGSLWKKREREKERPEPESKTLYRESPWSAMETPRNVDNVTFGQAFSWLAKETEDSLASNIAKLTYNR